MIDNKLKGLIAATCSPLHPDGSLNLDVVPTLVEHLLREGIAGLYVNGSTGEGMSLSSDERKAVAAAFVKAVNGQVPVIVQVGHNSLTEAQHLAEHSQQIDADCISATCPSYFKVNDVDTLVDCMAQIASGAPSLPFYYYHIPTLTGSTLDMCAFLRAAADRIPNLAGIKYTDTKLHEFQECLQLDDGRFDIVWGCDEMLLGALATGAKAAIGSTFNIAPAIYLKLMEAFEGGDLQQAREMQAKSIEMIRVLASFPFHPALKEVLSMLGTFCGPCRLPLPRLTTEQVDYLNKRISSLGILRSEPV